MNTNILNRLTFLYGDQVAASLHDKIETLLAEYQRKLPPQRSRTFSTQDTILITYGDQVQEAETPPLQALAGFLTAQVEGLIDTVHLLPFYPYSSDDGFSVIDYKAVNPDCGDWEDVGAVGENFRLMFDAVVNHISAHSSWFQRFLADDPAYRNFFTVVEPETDLSAVFRPRALPLLTPVETAVGTKHVWTTFSDDQIDLNFAHPDTLLAVIDTLLFYVAQGAEYIRLDAIAFIWKEIGTSCIHLPQTHEIIKLMRTVLDEIAPHVVLITETNVPHKDNVSYFGSGMDEAQMVYNFSLPPLTMHAFHTGRADRLTAWAATLDLPSNQVSFFNFLASHDGVGLTPAKGYLDADELETMAHRVKDLGGNVSYKNNSDGSRSAYELNINYLDALGDPTAPEETVKIKAHRFLASQAIMLALRGVPGIYFHSLFGSQNWTAGVAQTGRFRTINREKLDRTRLESELNDPEHLRYHIFQGYRRLLAARTSHDAFHPTADQEVITADPALFILRRWDQESAEQLLCIHNVSGQPQPLTLSLQPWAAEAEFIVDIISGEVLAVPDAHLATTIPPYGVRWWKM